ncbi:LacI family DNA-binding transcriptional regulator [Streptomyces hoynatensis]|uniref:LacI family transcriptional regulator n=1 Tax=Streptomyces hoynatensis TaxID=1141874 RepID=A0A3A9YUG7_9ACTN|nr:LacI family DNA-binding transcriptional regulator [Streptomyces hoynatensis]RKN39703.1 LacI family transcriptional regulator [Streptomyces hoynatensis]
MASAAGEDARRAGIREVAAVAGVSMSTVSNVLNRPETVAPATRHRVVAAMDRVGYVRNSAARQLRGAPSKVVGCLFLDSANAYYAALARGVEDRLGEAGCVLVQCSTDVRPEREVRCLRLLEEQNVRGLLVSPVSALLGHLVQLSRRGTPVVLLDRPRGGANLCAATVDNVAGGELAARHLVELGHRRLAFVRVGSTVRSIDDRVAGIKRALRAAGLDPRESLTEIPVAPAAPDTVAARSAEALLGLAPRPTGVICCNDATALAVLRGARARGLSVPEDFSLVGYDDVDFAAALSPALTTVRQPTYRLGHAAADLLLSEDHPDHEHRELVFRPQLVVRESTRATP